MRATEILKEEHKLILRAVAIVETMAQKAERGENVPTADVEDILRFLEDFADRHHQGREEAVLFPAMVKARPAEYDKLTSIAFEHDQERSLVDGIQEAIRTHKSSHFAYYATRLTQILRTHIQKEDDILFNIVNAIFSPEQDARVAQELITFDHSWEEGEFPALLMKLADLERKYVTPV